MNQRGLALPVALGVTAVVLAVLAVLSLRSLQEARHTRGDVRIVQTLALARGGTATANALLATTIRAQLDKIVAPLIDTTSPWAFGEDDGTGTAPTPQSVAQDLELVAEKLQSEVDRVVCDQDLAPSSLPGAHLTLRIHFTESACGQPLPLARLAVPRYIEGPPRTTDASGVQVYSLPFVAVVDARIGDYRRRVVSSGEYRFSVGRGSFARYALFTNHHTNRFGDSVWFTSRTLFDGPVHTNEHFRFDRRPWFGGAVTSAGCWAASTNGCGRRTAGAYFAGRGFVRARNMRPSPAKPRYGRTAPEFAAGVDWSATFIRMPLSDYDQSQAAAQGGLYFSRDLKDLVLKKTCFDDADQPVACSTAGARPYQVIRATVCLNYRCSRTRTEVYRFNETGALEVLKRGVWRSYGSSSSYRFNGVIYAKGRIRSLRGGTPALARFSQITVVGAEGVRITGHLTYEDPPCTGYPKRNRDGTVTPANCDNLTAKNILGVYAPWGDIAISKYAPRNLQIHAVLMAARGEIHVEDFAWIPDKGAVRILGGMIENYYGAFGTYDPYTGEQVSGYSRRLVYDKRLARGLAPPFFPTTEVDRVVDARTLTYGEREQLY